MVAREGVDGVGGHDPRLAVVTVLEAPGAVRIVDEHRVRPVAADRAHDVAQELARLLEEPVRIAQHDDVPHAHEIGGGALLGGPLAGQLGRRQRALGSAGIAVGAQHVGHLAPGRHPARDHAARADLGIVGMGEDHHGAVGDVGHDLELAVHRLGRGGAGHGEDSTGGMLEAKTGRRHERVQARPEGRLRVLSRSPDPHAPSAGEPDAHDFGGIRHAGIIASTGNAPRPDNPGEIRMTGTMMSVHDASCVVMMRMPSEI